MFGTLALAASCRIVLYPSILLLQELMYKTSVAFAYSLSSDPVFLHTHNRLSADRFCFHSTIAFIRLRAYVLQWKSPKPSSRAPPLHEEVNCFTQFNLILNILRDPTLFTYLVDITASFVFSS